MDAQQFTSDHQKAAHLNAQAVPVGYVAGMGRGAVGFTTRSDIGPARAAQTSTEEERAQNTYDEFAGYGGSLFKNVPYEKDDEAADKVWQDVDDYMAARHTKQHERKRAAEALEAAKSARPKLAQQFEDLKRNLGGVTEDEWANLPEVGDYTVKRQKREFFTPVPDSMLEAARQEHAVSTTIDPREQQRGGATSSLGAATDLRSVGEGRGTLLSMSLDKASDSVTGQTVVDPMAYATSLNSLNVHSEAEVGDIKKARLLLKSVRQTNPTHGPAWIASARLEEVAGKLTAARNIILEGCVACPKSVDVWLEAARMQTPEKARVVLGRAVKELPEAVQIWISAAKLETEAAMKRKILRRALEFVPTSVTLWKEAVGIEEPDDARIMLSRAVECVPQSVEMWLALARLETYDSARAVLNKARKALPTERAIWIHAAKLEEANGHSDRLDRIITNAMRSLEAHKVYMTRAQWMSEACAAERAGSADTAQAIIRATIDKGVDEVDRERTWTDDGEELVKKGHIACARAVYQHALSVFADNDDLWVDVAFVEKEHGTAATLEAHLERAVKAVPYAEVVWLMWAKEKWVSGDVDGARGVLEAAFEANPGNEEIFLAAVKLERENGQTDRARILLAKARESANTERVWMKSALLERDVGNHNAEEALLQHSVKAFPQYDKFHLMLGQLHSRAGNVVEAKRAFLNGLRNCAQSVPLWLAVVRMEEDEKHTTKCRALLETARKKCKANPTLWLEAVRVEARAGNLSMAHSTLAKGLQECQTSGALWAEAIYLEPREGKKRRSLDALKKCDNDPHVFVATALFFLQKRSIDKARAWLTKAIKVEPDLGDSWARLYRFEKQYGDDTKVRDLVTRCTKAAPKHGEVWQRVSKSVLHVHKSVEEKLELASEEFGERDAQYHRWSLRQ